jgi:hypothetical protein
MFPAESLRTTVAIPYIFGKSDCVLELVAGRIITNARKIKPNPINFNIISNF